MTLGNKLLALRKKSGMSQEEVSDGLGVSCQAVSKWKTDQTTPELAKVELLSKLYNISYYYPISESHNVFSENTYYKIYEAIETAFSKLEL
ncbi:helix-turn-helix domain-containing protein [Clostridium tyrobutyricum]|jgi:transcriptional regulator with XRE-family HTH domain|uniref:helix-turn-helix transcriptional regulator n=1 Tax=Clostridium tyrobutyricum TaxID=1519 RepID=UPI00038104C8|nr:helix-turn-helix transcriptional regulator [Clostridium tyrobutyricum]ANP70420.1 transcriptional regulator [Clostridium tyrobutyricum]MBV4434649.1 helix-turn-helix domain-containing protein [Clostridium tyrobutyricum]MBV4445979.1 helix-turn-helix domain-containing protein [Clostridium tyrobutyricum]QNB67947.1 helix-turn-helix domain-containing protein [Clostridium tyrobutyricum]